MTEGITYKIKIQRGDTLIEIEGDKEFVENKYNELADTLQQARLEAPNGASLTDSSTSRSPRGSKRAGGKRAVTGPKTVELGIDKQKLQAFYNTKSPGGHEEKFAVFCYYLKENHDLNEVTVDEVFTCYRLLNVRGPEAWTQKFRDAKSRKSWFNKGSEQGKYAISTIGEEFVIHDLPSKPVKEEK